jgi:hypothetical protein
VFKGRALRKDKYTTAEKSVQPCKNCIRTRSGKVGFFFFFFFLRHTWLLDELGMFTATKSTQGDKLRESRAAFDDEK